jgi:hypothetical protein
MNFLSISRSPNVCLGFLCRRIMSGKDFTPILHLGGLFVYVRCPPNDTKKFHRVLYILVACMKWCVRWWWSGPLPKKDWIFSNHDIIQFTLHPIGKTLIPYPHDSFIPHHINHPSSTLEVIHTSWVSELTKWSLPW